MTEQEICGLFRDYSLYLFEGQSSYGKKNPVLKLLHNEYKIEDKKCPEYNILFEIEDLNITWLRDKVCYMPLPDDYMVMSNIPSFTAKILFYFPSRKVLFCDSDNIVF